MQGVFDQLQAPSLLFLLTQAVRVHGEQLSRAAAAVQRVHSQQLLWSRRGFAPPFTTQPVKQRRGARGGLPYSHGRRIKTRVLLMKLYGILEP